MKCSALKKFLYIKHFRFKQPEEIFNNSIQIIAFPRPPREPMREPPRAEGG